MRLLWRLAKAPVTADLPPCGGDVRQDRGWCEGTPTSELDVLHSLDLQIAQLSSFDMLAGQHPPLSCRTSPPQGGRLAVACGSANLQRGIA
ncbi:hypothetical protein EN844_03090 [Mesorhizobium sp. M3A.F.Ca.ET.201.01.1.1]|nr:hypothetical protein EN844_03090 [Mesorhizobium sp. M3A.F.Ca.ET.201.01.1.1]